MTSRTLIIPPIATPSAYIETFRPSFLANALNGLNTFSILNALIVTRFPEDTVYESIYSPRIFKISVDTYSDYDNEEIYNVPRVPNVALIAAVYKAVRYYLQRCLNDK